MLWHEETMEGGIRWADGVGRQGAQRIFWGELPLLKAVGAFVPFIVDFFFFVALLIGPRS